MKMFRCICLYHIDFKSEEFSGMLVVKASLS